MCYINCFRLSEKCLRTVRSVLDWWNKASLSCLELLANLITEIQLENTRSKAETHTQRNKPLWFAFCWKVIYLNHSFVTEKRKALQKSVQDAKRSRIIPYINNCWLFFKQTRGCGGLFMTELWSIIKVNDCVCSFGEKGDMNTLIWSF